MNCSRFYILITLLVLLPTTGIQAAPPSIPEDYGDVFYRLGGGKVLLPPGARYQSYSIRARIRVGLGYSCGKFNFQDNISQMINELESQVRELPSQLTNAATAFVASLPTYFMMKRAPTLYNIVTKTLDESAELFRLSYKSCKEIERELRRDPDSNPYQGFLKAGVADVWEWGADNGELAADMDQSIKDNPPTSVRWLGGHDYGTESNPIQINRDIVVAGYNILIGRTDDVSLVTAPTAPEQLAEPIVQIWANPELAGRWAQDVLGDQIIVLGDDAPEPDSIAGKGLRPKVESLEQPINEALDLAINTNDYVDLNRYASLRVSALLVESLRNMPIGDAAVMTDRLISELSVNEAVERLLLVKQMMMAGLKAPDVIASTGGSTASDYIRNTTFPDMDRVKNDVYDALELKQRTLNRTTVSILNRAESLRNSAAGAQPGQIKTIDNALGGAQGN